MFWQFKTIMIYDRLKTIDIRLWALNYHRKTWKYAFTQSCVEFEVDRVKLIDHSRDKLRGRCLRIRGFPQQPTAKCIESNILISDWNIIFFLCFQGSFGHEVGKKTILCKVMLKLKLCQKPILAGYFNAARNEPFAVKHEGD